MMMKVNLILFQLDHPHTGKQLISVYMVKKDRYRPLFCNSEFYLKNQEQFGRWKLLFKDLTIEQKVISWICGLSLLRRPKDWYGGKRLMTFVPSSVDKNHPLSLSELTKNTIIEIPMKLDSQMNLFELANSIRIKALPEGSLRALTKCGSPDFNVEMIYSIPTALELLTYQLNGKRVVSFNEDFLIWPTTLYHGRDFLSFMIHDLIHSDHFLNQPMNRLGQLGFYRCINSILKEKSLKKLLQNQKFKDGFEYIISDMNSHPVHLFKTLHARVRDDFGNSDLIPPAWLSWTRVWSSEDSKTFSALQKINTQLFSHKDAEDITDWCIALGHN